MELRLATEASPKERKDLWTDTFVLLGLRYPHQSVVQFFRGIPAMREADTYQVILEEGIERGMEQGRLAEAKRVFFLVGTPRFGEPDPAVRERIEVASDLARIEEWLRRTGTAESWSDLPHLGP